MEVKALMLWPPLPYLHQINITLEGVRLRCPLQELRNLHA